MPSIRINDNFGVVLDIPVESPLKKYLRNDLVDLVALPELKSEFTKSLGESTLKPAGGALNFKDSFDLGPGGTELSIAAGGSAGIAIHKENTELIGGDLIGDRATVPAGQAFISTLLTARVAPGVSQTTGTITFGFDADSEVKLQNYRSFPATQTVGDAFKAGIGGFSLPADLDDLCTLPENAIASVSGSGSLTLTASADVSAAPNPLAIPGLPAAIPAISLKSGASVGVSASFHVGGAYEVRVRKVDPRTVRLGYYKKDESGFTVGVEARAGITAGTGKQDWIVPVLRAVSQDPQADANQFQQAGLRSEQIDEINAGIKDGVQRSLAASLSTEFSSLRTGEAAFLYDIDLNAANSNERVQQAIHAALKGDISLLVKADEPGNLDGITLRRSVWKAARERGLTLRINLLGILNFASVSKLLVEGTVVTDLVTGEVTITDQATAKRLRTLMVNFGENQDKVRRLFFEAMIATVTYRASDVLKDFDVKSSQSYFELHQKTNTQTMRDNLDAIEAVGLLDAAGKEKALAHGEPFGRSTFLLESSYDDEQCRRIFFDDDKKPRAEAYYENAARRALAALVLPGDPDAQRGAAAADDELWKRLKSDGSPSGNMAILREKFGAGTPLPLLTTMDGDFAFIAAFWAPALHKTAKKLEEVRTFLKEHPNAKPDDRDFQKLRNDLAKHLAAVAKDTKERFGDPLGLVALHYASGRSGQISAKLACGSFSLSLPMAAVAGRDSRPV